ERATPLRRGMRVEVVHAREVTVLVGDSERQVVSAALTVDELIGDLRRAGRIEGATPRRVVRPSRLSRVRSGMVVEIADPVPVTVSRGGRTSEVTTTAATVAEVLDHLGVELGAAERVTPGLEAPVTPGMEVTV